MDISVERQIINLSKLHIYKDILIQYYCTVVENIQKNKENGKGRFGFGRPVLVLCCR